MPEESTCALVRFTKNSLTFQFLLNNNRKLGTIEIKNNFRFCFFYGQINSVFRKWFVVFVARDKWYGRA